MSVLPSALQWRRLDVPGSEHAAFDGRNGLVARGVAMAADPVPYVCRYDLVTDDGWGTTLFEASAEGGGWLRTVRLERAAGRWRVTTAEQGALDAALAAAGHPAGPAPGIDDPERLVEARDIDLAASPLTNTLPIRRLGLGEAAPGTVHTIVAAWVLLPSLAVVPSRQRYTVSGAHSVTYASGSFSADLTLDPAGFVVDYPTLAIRS